MPGTLCHVPLLKARGRITSDKLFLTLVSNTTNVTLVMLQENGFLYHQCHATFVMPRKMSSSYPNVFTYSYEGSSFTLDQGNDSNNIPPACVLSTGAICPEEKESPEKRKKSPTKDINQWTLCASYWSKPPTNHLMATPLTIIQSTDRKMNVKEILIVLFVLTAVKG